MLTKKLLGLMEVFHVLYKLWERIRIGEMPKL